MNEQQMQQSDWRHQMAQAQHRALDHLRIIDMIRVEGGLSRDMLTGMESALPNEYPIQALTRHPSQTAREDVEANLHYLSQQGIGEMADVLSNIYQSVQDGPGQAPEQMSPTATMVQSCGHRLIVLEATNKAMIKAITLDDPVAMRQEQQRRDEAAKGVVNVLSDSPAVGQHHSPNEALCAITELLSANEGKVSDLTYPGGGSWPSVDTAGGIKRCQALKERANGPVNRQITTHERDQQAKALKQVADDLMAVHAYQQLVTQLSG